MQSVMRFDVKVTATTEDGKSTEGHGSPHQNLINDIINEMFASTCSSYVRRIAAGALADPTADAGLVSLTPDNFTLAGSTIYANFEVTATRSATITRVLMLREGGGSYFWTDVTPLGVTSGERIRVQWQVTFKDTHTVSGFYADRNATVTAEPRLGSELVRKLSGHVVGGESLCLELAKYFDDSAVPNELLVTSLSRDLSTRTAKHAPAKFTRSGKLKTVQLESASRVLIIYSLPIPFDVTTNDTIETTYTLGEIR